jgi:hypothetical protein
MGGGDRLWRAVIATLVDFNERLMGTADDLDDNLSLWHDVGGSANLAFDLLSSPARCLNRSWCEVAICLGLLDKSSQPILTEGLNKLSIGISIGKITE